MNKFFLLAAVAISLTACNTEDNYIIDEPVAAHISATIGVNAAFRASDAAWDPGDNIGITMNGRYLNMQYSTENGDGTFTGNTMFFRNKEDKVSISAYYPFTGTEGEMPGAILVSTSSEHQTAAEQADIDFLYAVKENVSGADPYVNLLFSHMMSKLTFIFVNGNEGTDASKITSCEINGLILQGTFTPSTGECVVKADSPLSSLKLTPAEVNGKLLASAIIFPQTVRKLSLRIRDNQDQDYAGELNLGTEGIVSGNNYQFTIKVKKTEMSITSEITNWKTEASESEAESAD